YSYFNYLFLDQPFYRATHPASNCHGNHAENSTIAGLNGKKPAVQKDARKALLSDKAIFRFSSFEWFE
ncbi:TPA: hypothetical protein ACWW8T_005212, partial [Escherichia coli]